MRASQVVIVLVLIWAIAATTVAVRTYLELDSLKRACSPYLSGAIVVDLCIDYGNGTVEWFNGTVLPRGSTVFTALEVKAKVEYVYGQYGVYVKSVNGVEEVLGKGEGWSWLWYLYDEEKKAYVPGPVAADKYTLKGGEIILWIYEHWKA